MSRMSVVGRSLYQVQGVAPSVAMVPIAMELDPGVSVLCDPGIWNDADSYSYEWFHGSSGISSGINGQSYEHNGAWSGQDMYCVVTAHNAYGESSAQSNNVAVS
jgi:hypothetical protein